MSVRYTFWKLLTENSIVIPPIQRDYAQGRPGEYERRIASKLVNDIKISLLNRKPINLDFIYGKTHNCEFIPLDGQQRLTSLYLIHWYLASRNGELEDHSDLLSKFTYKTRVTSTDFCTQLVNKGISFEEELESVSEKIEDSPWFFLSWHLDPTVVSMLNMLNVIHKAFKDIDVSDFLNAVIYEHPGLITFDLLELRDYNLTDDLYIKMNARGKPLTEFENVKAKITRFLKSNSRKLDNEWQDIFWRLEAESENRAYFTDRSFYAFFKNITINLYLDRFDAENERTFIDSFDVLTNIIKILDNQEALSLITQSLDHFVQTNEDDSLLMNFVHPIKGTNVDYSDRLKFHSYSKFILNNSGLSDTNRIRFYQWMRVSNNLINNTIYDDPVAFMRAIRSIHKISAYSTDIYSALVNDAEITGFSREQVEEEKLKAILIKMDFAWEDLFKNLESSEYFDGQIGFILDFAKTSTDAYDSDLFIDLANIVSMLFSDQFQENHDFLFQRALLTFGDYLIEPDKTGLTKSFCMFDNFLRAKRDNWRKVFRDPIRSPYLKSLLFEIRETVNDCNSADEIRICLQSIVASSPAIGWRRYFIEQPAFIRYCKSRHIVFDKGGKNKIYLLSKKIMACWHEELFSKDLSLRLKISGCSPFTNCEYFPSYSKEVEPYLYLSEWVVGDSEFSMKITNEGTHYKLLLHNANNSLVPDSIEEALHSIGFTDKALSIQEDDPLPTIKQVLDALEQLA